MKSALTTSPLPPARTFALLLFTACLSMTLPSCETNGGGGASHPLISAQNKIIAKEPRGNYFVGRRYFLPKTRWWGFIRKPGQPWSKSKAVIMQERTRLTPDRITEGTYGPDGRGHGYDHNFEYIIRGRYTGREFYDPNGNIFVPEFLAESYELKDKSPGFLFHPQETYNPDRVPVQATNRR